MSIAFSFAENVKRLGLQPADKVLLAFSGGPDSVFLLREAVAFFQKGQVEAAYVDYHDSPAAADEEKLVKATAKKFKVKLHRLNMNLDSGAANFEAKAREIRYAFFAKLVKKCKFKGVLVAHQKNDDAETYLLQKQRQGIVKTLGLAAKTKINGIIVYRPLLNITKPEIIARLKEANIAFFTDPTNETSTRERSLLRRQNFNLDATLKERDKDFSKNAEEQEKAQEFIAESRYLLTVYRAFNPRLRKRICHDISQILFPELSDKKIIGVTNLIFEYLKAGNTRELFLAKGIYLYKDSESFFFAPRLKKHKYRHLIKGAGKHRFPEVIVDVTDPSSMKIQAFPLTVKTIKKGDYLDTKLAANDALKFLKKQKVPLYLRDYYPALYRDKKRICYIPFYAKTLDHREKVEPVLPVPLLPKVR